MMMGQLGVTDLSCVQVFMVVLINFTCVWLILAVLG